jgi:Tfp pilus assembly protein PilX
MLGCRDESEQSAESGVSLGQDQRGIAMLTVIMVMLILTILGVAAMTVSGLENNIAGIQRRTEAATIAVESCVGTGANIIEQTIMASSLPTAFKSPAGPVPATNFTTLSSEIMGQSDNNADDPSVAPNISLNVGAYTVVGDIDRLYAKGISGGSQVFAGAYEGYGQGAGAGGVEVHYRISCLATDTATGTNTHTTAVYACVAAGDGCQRKL